MTETEVAIAAGAASAAATNAAAASTNPSEEQDQLHGWYLLLDEKTQASGICRSVFALSESWDTKKFCLFAGKAGNAQV